MIGMILIIVIVFGLFMGVPFAIHAAQGFPHHDD